MLLTLEALDANEGDALLLLYGTARRPRLVMIDGGPRQTCRDALLPRLLALRAAFPGGRRAPLPVELLVVTHVDSDHIAGVLALTAGLREARSAGDEPPVHIKELWHNGFDGAVGEETIVRALEFVDALPWDSPADRGLVASVAEGRRLLDDAAALDIAVNAEFAGLVLRPDDAGVVVPCGDGLTLTVLGPARGQLDAFRKDWQAAVRARPEARGGVAGAGLDTSRPNLASIVLLADDGDHTLLLAGDARGDHILAGLAAAGKLAPDGTLHVDLFKLPHHGSCRNNTRELLTRVTADTYVISADGKHGNPDRETLDRLAAARGDDLYTVVCTFPERADELVAPDQPDADERRAALRSFRAWAARQAARGVTFVYRDPQAPGVTIALGDETLA